MATERKKFKIPTADEINESTNSSSSSLSSFSRFQQLKKEGKVTDACDLDKSLRTDKKAAESSSDQPQSSISVIQPRNVFQRNSSNTVTQTTSSTTSTSGTMTQSNKPSTSSAVPEKSVPTAVKSMNTNSIIVNSRQRGNPILKFIRSIPYEFGDIIPDYEMGKTSCALFLSLRYHQLNPNYIHERLKQLRRYYDLRVLLVQVDIKEPHHLVKELAKICILADCTFILAFSPEEAGRYLETYKVYEHKPPEAIMEKTEKDYMSKVTECLTSVKSVNKTDAMTLLSTFHTMEGALKASQEDLSFCPGFGPQKAKRTFDLFNEPFLKSKKKK
jgi:DNA excision repair protein ERCC-1